MKNGLITAIDFETTGSVRGFKNEPWQIGLIEFSIGDADSGNMFGSYLKVDKDRPFNMYAPGRHAQIRGVLAESPSLPELWPQLSPRLTGHYLVAHNIGTERSVLAEAFPLYKSGPWIDTLVLARKAWPGLASYALEDLMPRLGFASHTARICPGLAPHDALYDAAACAILFCGILALPGWKDLAISDLPSVI